MKLFDSPKVNTPRQGLVKRRSGTRKRVSDSKPKCHCDIEKLTYIGDSVLGESIFYCFKCNQFKKVEK